MFDPNARLPFQQLTLEGVETEEGLYTFNGQVIRFGKSLGYLTLQTRAKTAAQARSNLLFQAKKKCNLQPNAAGLRLEGTISKEAE